MFMNQKILIILIIILVLLTAGFVYFSFFFPKRETKTIETAQLNFSYAQVLGLESRADPESMAQNWEGNKLKVVANKVANLCAKKTGGYAINGDSITLTITENIQTLCDGFDLFGFTFLVGPLEKRDYNVSVIFISE